MFLDAIRRVHEGDVHLVPRTDAHASHEERHAFNLCAGSTVQPLSGREASISGEWFTSGAGTHRRRPQRGRHIHRAAKSFGDLTHVKTAQGLFRSLHLGTHAVGLGVEVPYGSVRPRTAAAHQP